MPAVVYGYKYIVLQIAVWDNELLWIYIMLEIAVWYNELLGALKYSRRGVGGIMKTIYKCLLVEDKITIITRANMFEFRI